MLQYTPAQLLVLRPAAPVISRSVRKSLFHNRLWLPKNRRKRLTVSLNILQRSLTGSTTSDAKPISCGKLLHCACLNAHSIRNKAAAITTIFSEHNLDILGLTETWHQCDSDIALRRIIPSGYSCTQAARQATLSNSGSDPRIGGGLPSSTKTTLP